jgi:hypothetical protein
LLFYIAPKVSPSAGSTFTHYTGPAGLTTVSRGLALFTNVIGFKIVAVLQFLGEECPGSNKGIDWLIFFHFNPGP